MTREFMESGQSVPVTVIRVEKGRVLDIISKDKRGYSAIKLGFFRLKNSKLTKGKKVKVSGFKKAIITLKKGQSIDLTTGI